RRSAPPRDASRRSGLEGTRGFRRDPPRSQGVTKMKAQVQRSSRSAPTAAPRATDKTDTDQVVSLHGISWETYETLTEAIGDSPAPRTTYLEGELELMSPGFTHEYRKTLTARLVWAWADERELPLIGLGSLTFRKKPKKA